MSERRPERKPERNPSLERWRRSAQTTFLVHLGQTGLGIMAAALWSTALLLSFGDHPDGLHALRWSGAITVEVLGTFFRRTAGFAILFTLGGLVAWWILSTPLQMFWLTTMDQPRSLRERAAIALRRSPSAVATSLLMLGPLVIALAITIGLPSLWAFAFGDDPDPRWKDIGILLALIPGLGLLWGWATWHDLARAGTALGLGPVQAIRKAWRIRAAGLYAMFWLAGALLSAFALNLPGPTWWILIGAQIALLARTYVRAGWLSAAVTRMNRALPQ